MNVFDGPDFDAELEFILNNFPQLTQAQAENIAFNNVMNNNMLHLQDFDADEPNPEPEEDPSIGKRANGLSSSSIYCFKCKQKTNTKNLNKVTQNDKNGKSRIYLKGQCSDCGTNKSQIAPGSKGGMMPKRPPGSPKKQPPGMQGKIPIPNFNFGPNPNPMPNPLPPKMVKQPKYAMPNVKGKLQPKNLFG